MRATGPHHEPGLDAPDFGYSCQAKRFLERTSARCFVTGSQSASVWGDLNPKARVADLPGRSHGRHEA